MASRYDMYREYTDNQGGNTLDLPRWYKWYRVEKLSEGHAMAAPPVQGCSVETGTEAQGPVVGEAEFLDILEQFRATRRR